MQQPLISIVNGIARHPDFRLAHPVQFSLHAGEHTVVYGPNGGGKTLFAALMTGAQPALGLGVQYHWPEGSDKRLHERIRSISFRDVYGGNEPAYYQQRWNRFDEQEFPTVGEVLARMPYAHAALCRELGMDEHADKCINLLSSGELRRLQLVQALGGSPDVLVIDSPYIGLDAAVREMLTSVLETLSHQLTLVVLASRAQDIPHFIQSGVWVEDGLVGPRLSTQELTQHERTVSAVSADLPEAAAEVAPELPACDELVGFDHITIRYGQRTILDNLSWQVNRGEHWALTGENGAGKSTLLSLVCADNPQAYACNITLFGHRRGRGESIWDIKRHIGYVSPEMFSTYRKPLPAIDIVASGLHDTIGLYRRISDEERAACAEWMRAFGASHLAGRNYLQLSSGEQRLILLVRAFVKHPALLILDEPFHGLDARSRERARQLIDAYMALPGKTLVMVTHYPEELPHCIDHHLHLTKH